MQVLVIMKCMKVNKSPWSDQVYPSTLWDAGEKIAEILAEIYASSLSMGEVLEN